MHGLSKVYIIVESRTCYTFFVRCGNWRDKYITGPTVLRIASVEGRSF